MAVVLRRGYSRARGTLAEGGLLSWYVLSHAPAAAGRGGGAEAGLGLGLGSGPGLGLGLPQARWYSRPRGSLWRSRKGISKEALYALIDVKRAKGDSVNLGNSLQTTVARLLKVDLLAVLQELQRQNEVDLALKVFYMVRKEYWYKPDVYFYKDMLSCLARNKRVSECEALLKDSRTDGLPPDGMVLTEVMIAYFECGMLPQAVETFERMRKGSCPPDRPAFKVILRYLKKMNKKELRAKLRKEYLEFYEGVEPQGKSRLMPEDDDSEEEGLL